jgi:peptidoglycan/xylan/chitin deacetylase (PgdA/CDA1 family)
MVLLQLLPALALAIAFAGLFVHGADTYYAIAQKDDAKNVALTFDDGPHAMLTPKLLDVLKEKGAKATFFVMGIKAMVHPAILQRAVREGHEIANHVWDHPVLSKISYEKLEDQIKRTNDAIYLALNSTPAVMRPPYGNTNPKLNRRINTYHNMSVIMWSYDTNDWKRPPFEEISKKTIPNLKSGTVLLCHDIHPGTIRAMPLLVEQAMLSGFKFLTVSEMIANKK